MIVFENKFQLSSLKNENKFKSAENNFLKKLKTNNLKETDMRLENQQSQLPNYKIISIESNITIAKNKCNGIVKEIVKYQLSNGSFSLIIRKVSLAGSANSLIAFKLSSK